MRGGCRSYCVGEYTGDYVGGYLAIARSDYLGVTQWLTLGYRPATIGLAVPTDPVPRLIGLFLPPPIAAGHITGPDIGNQTGLIAGLQLMDLMRRCYRGLPGFDMHWRFGAAMGDVDTAGQYMIDFECGMLVKRITNPGSQQKQPYKYIIRFHNPAFTDELSSE